MNRNLQRILVPLAAISAVLVPLLVHLHATTWHNGTPLLQNIFPFFGLLAASLLWLHAISGVWYEKLEKLFNMDRFVHWTATLIFFSIILHPLLLLILVKFDFSL